MSVAFRDEVVCLSTVLHYIELMAVRSALSLLVPPSPFDNLWTATGTGLRHTKLCPALCSHVLALPDGKGIISL